jgi:hypothetical protein
VFFEEGILSGLLFKVGDRIPDGAIIARISKIEKT